MRKSFLIVPLMFSFVPTVHAGGWPPAEAAPTTITVAEPLEFPPAGPGEMAGYLFLNGEPFKALTTEQKAQGYCQVMNSFFDQTAKGERFEIWSSPSDLVKPYSVDSIGGINYSRFGLVAVDHSNADRPTIHIDIVTPETDPVKTLDILQGCLGKYFEVQ